MFTAEDCDEAAQNETLSKLTHSLTNTEREICEGLLTPGECHAALVGLQDNKTPGKELYLSFWELLGADLVRVVNSAYESGELSPSQRRGLITVLHKKDDRLETKNWRPISLLNCDYKVAIRALAGRLLSVIGKVVSPDHNLWCSGAHHW